MLTEIALKTSLELPAVPLHGIGINLIELLLALLFAVRSLAQATSIIVLSVFTLMNLALIRINSLRVTSETIHYPVFIPYIGAMLCIAMLIIKAAYFIS